MRSSNPVPTSFEDWRFPKVLLWAVASLSLLVAGFSSGQAAQIVLLSSLDVSKTVQSTGRAQVDKSYTGKPLSIAGRKFDHGLGTHALSKLAIDLKGSADRFAAQVGLDDNAAGKNATCNGSVVFAVFGDGRLLWKSGVMRWRQPAAVVDVNLKGIKTLLLVVSDARDGINCDHADWGDARFEISGEAPQTVVAAPLKQLQGEILTPRPPATPRINGAKVFGVRPGHPFLFTIPATGRRPMEFAVDNLPAGLKVDPQSGQITGALQDRGEYPVTFHAKNALGQAQRPFKIVCGDTLALTPHMGWNHWYIWSYSVSDKIIRAAADAMVSTGLIDHGYSYVNIDDCWTVRPGSTDAALCGPPRDAQGNINPNRRFPDMKALTDYIHAKGLKAGIYTGPVELTCARHVGCYQHEEQDARQYAKWGFDFLKYDSSNYKNVPQMGAILSKLDRDIVLNVVAWSIGGMQNTAKWGHQAGVHSWRTAQDLGGAWGLVVEDVFGLYGRNELQRYSGPGGWNDPDYICLGYVSPHAKTSLSPAEQYSYVSIWCLSAAPLIFSGDITRLDDFTLGLLTNDEVLDVDQDPLGKAAVRVAKHGNAQVWAKDMEDGRKVVGLFNIDDDLRTGVFRVAGEMPSKTTATVTWTELGIPGKQIVRDLWRQKDLGTFEGRFSAPVDADGVVLVSLRPAPRP
jgi:alpha-galactosidase